MAGTMVHFTVAYQLMKPFVGSLWEGRYYAGSVAPDGIHCREGYQRSMKMITHFRDGIPDDDFHRPEMYEVFLHRLESFMREREDCKADMQPVYLGYLVHVLTDAYFVRTIREEFVASMAREGKTVKNEAFFEEFTFDVNQIDFWLATKMPVLREIESWVLRIPAIDVPGYLTRQELSDSREWIWQMYFEGERVAEQTRHIPFARIPEFIRQCARWIQEQEIYRYYYNKYTDTRKET